MIRGSARLWPVSVLVSALAIVAGAAEAPPARVVQFPGDQSMGTLYVRPWDEWQNTPATSEQIDANWQPYQPAQGNVEIPEGMAVRFVPEGSAVYDLYPLANLGADDIQSIDFRRTEVQDAQIQYIEGMHLNELLFEHTEITDRALDYIEDMTSLQYLGVGRTQVTNAGMPSLQGLTNLRGLDLNLTGVDDAGLSYLQDIRELESLDLWMANITDASMAQIGSLQQLRELGLEGALITDAGIQALAQLGALESLNLEMTGLTNEGLAALTGLSQLNYLALLNTRVDEGGLSLLQQLTQLESMRLPFTISPAALALLQSLGVAHNLDRERVPVALAVVSAEDGTPVADASVELSLASGDRQPVYAWTDASGQSSLHILAYSGDVLHVTIYAEAYSPGEFLWNYVEEPEKTFELHGAVTVGGIVVDEAGEAVDEASVQLPVPGTRDFTRDVIPAHSEITGADGQWTCAHAPSDLSTLSLTVSHPQYTETTFGADDLSIASLKSLTQVLPLVPSFTLAGRVVTEEGVAVPYAVVTELERRRFEQSLAPTEHSATTDSEGQFELRLTREGPMDLKTGATGFPPDIRTVEVHRDMGPIEIVLGIGSVLRARVVDATGIGIADVDVQIGTKYYGPGRTVPADDVAPWQTKTDAQGRFVWTEAPAVEAPVLCRKPGYMPAEQVLAPSDDEHVIVLETLFAIVGTVVDDTTNEAISEYEVSLGVTRDAGFAPSQWQTMSHGTNSGDDFRITPSRHSPYYVVRMHAPGYLTAESEVIAHGDGEVRRDFRLKRAEAITGVVIDGEGALVEGASVAIATADNPVRLVGDPPVGFSSGTASATDAEGRFSLDGCDEPYVIVAVHATGYAFVAHPDHEKGGTIPLHPWSRVKGSIEGIGAGEETAVHWMLWYGAHSPGAPEIMITQSVECGPDEAVEFNAAPALPMFLSRHIGLGPDVGQNVLTHQEVVEVRAEETVQVDVGEGARMTGRVTGGRPSDAGILVVEMTQMDNPAPDGPDLGGMSKDALALFTVQRHEDQEWRAFLLKCRAYGALVGDDGTFHIDGVDAGNYRVQVLRIGSDMARIDVAETVVEVPEAVDGVVEIGTIELQE